MGIKAIRQELESMGIGTNSFIEKSEFVNALLDARNERKARCADCGKEEGDGVSLKTCTSCLLVKYCSAKCQKNNWPEHKKLCKERAAELREEALFKDPPSKEDCPICCLPMSMSLVYSASLPPATITSVPIHDFLVANEALASVAMEAHYDCCGKNICQGCIYSAIQSGNNKKCPFCNSEITASTDDESFEEMKKRVEANNADAMVVLANHYNKGIRVLQDQKKA
jgi:hypothetical protein